MEIIIQSKRFNLAFIWVLNACQHFPSFQCFGKCSLFTIPKAADTSDHFRIFTVVGNKDSADFN